MRRTFVVGKLTGSSAMIHFLHVSAEEETLSLKVLGASQAERQAAGSNPETVH